MKGSGAEACAEGPFLKWQKRRERGDPSPPRPRAGKRELPTSGSSDSAGPGSSETAAKPPHVQEQPQGVQVNRAGAAVCAGRAQSPLLATQVAGIALPGDMLAMVSSCGKAVARRSVGTQTEAPRKDTAVQVSGCRECLILALVPEDSRDNSCVRCEQVNGLLSLVAELKEEVERLRNIQECVRARSTAGATPCPP